MGIVEDILIILCSAAIQIYLCRRMLLGLNPGLLWLWHWPSDALTIHLDLSLSLVPTDLFCYWKKFQRTALNSFVIQRWNFLLFANFRQSACARGVSIKGFAQSCLDSPGARTWMEWSANPPPLPPTPGVSLLCGQSLLFPHPPFHSSFPSCYPLLSLYSFLYIKKPRISILWKLKFFILCIFLPSSSQSLCLSDLQYFRSSFIS